MSKNSYDVIIIGAGSIGNPTAFFLAEAGFKVLVLEQFASVGQGSNKAAIGGVRATHSDPAKINLCLQSIEVFSTWEQRYGDHIGWVQGGYSFVAYRDKEEQALKELLNIQKEYGLHIDWLDKDMLLEVIPSLNPEGLRGGTYSPHDGSASPLLSAAAFYRMATKHKAHYRFQEHVTAFEIKGNRVLSVQTDKGRYAADAIINAAGPWAREVSQMAKVDVPVTPDSHEAGVTEAVARFLTPMVVDMRPTSDSANYYFYQHDTGQLIFCITPHPSIWGTDRRETSIFLPQIARRMVNLIPRLQYLKVRRTWRGLYPMTPDGVPIVGKLPQLENFIFAVGMCGQGFMLGPGVGKVLTRLLKNELDRQDHRILDDLRPGRNFGGRGQEKLA
ncbi:putative oxidoreductase [Candidatus Vecturithrix granuli]|uniref:Putative oxidoreductase n=1 Tax=Vecturithrix granuli TaxID=1499967 RepID=A0A081C627_VECG1|nr:putative oxidoreductase [Candidatus Vecturithrix granuli]